MASVGSEEPSDPEEEPDRDADADSADGDRGRDRVDNLEQRLAEQKLIEAFAAAGFQGPLYEDFRNETIRYGLSVAHAWLLSGHVFTQLNQRGIPLKPTMWELECLRTDPDARCDIADMAVTVAWRKFEERALRGREWTVDGGATLATYFTGGVLYEIPGPFKQWRRHLYGHMGSDLHDHLLHHRSRQGLDPAVQVADDCALHLVLECLLEPQKQAVLLTIAGYHQSEIAVILGLVSSRAVEGLLRRARIKVGEYLAERSKGGG